MILNRVIEFLNNVLKKNFDVKDTRWVDGNFKSKSCRLRFILFHWMVK